MKILYLYMFPLWGNGSGTWLRKLTRYLKELQTDIEIQILAPETRKIRHAKIRPIKPPVMGVFVGNPELKKAKKFSKISTFDHIRIYNHYLRRAAQVVKDFKPNLIHAFHTAFLPPVALTISQLFKIPFIITTHGSDLYYLQEDKRWRELVKIASKKAKFITANSNFTRDWYLKMFGKDLSKKTKTIPAGIDNKIDFTRDVSWIDKKYNFKYDKMVLFTGRLTEHKGVEYLIKAARKIEAEIVILGDGPERKYLESLIQKYKLNNVHMLGYFSQRLGQINDFYLRADVYVAPSVWNEPLGLVILEAMVHKTPVIATRKGGITTILKDGINGFTVRAKDPNMIAKKVNLLLKDNKLRKKMAETAYKTVIKRFTWEKVANKFYNLYTKCIK